MLNDEYGHSWPCGEPSEAEQYQRAFEREMRAVGRWLLWVFLAAALTFGAWVVAGPWLRTGEWR